MVKPGGTGSPALLISARPAPLPPRTSFILPLPSALPPPNEYTYLVAGFAPFTGASASGTVIVAMIAFFLLGKFFNFSGQPPSAALRGESPDLQDSKYNCSLVEFRSSGQPRAAGPILQISCYCLPSVTISEKSAIVENSFNSVCSSASRLARSCSFSTITITLSKNASTAG